MKHFRFCFVLSLFFAALFALSAYAAPGDPVTIRIFVASHLSASDYHVEPADSNTRILPSNVSEEGEVYALYTFELQEGAAYDFVYLPNDDGDFPLPITLRLTASASASEYICDAVAGRLQERPSPSPTASPESGSGGSSSDDPDYNLTIDTDNSGALVLANTGAPAPIGNPGDTVLITLPLAVNREYFPTEHYALRNITIEPAIPERRRGDTENIHDWPFDIEKASYLRIINDMGFGARADVTYEFRISQDAEAGKYPILFDLNATVWRYDAVNGFMIAEDVTFRLTQYVTVLDPGGAGAAGALELSSLWNGAALPAPRGKGGDRITVFLPLVSNGALTGVTIEPVFSANADECPVVFEAINYSKNIPDLARGESALAEFNFKLLPDEDGGNKPLTFKAKYRNGGAAGECLLTTFLYVEPTADDESEAQPTPSPEPPVLTLEGYALAVEGQASEILYAGESARLNLQLRNNASSSSAHQLRLTIAPGDALLLEPGMSGEKYIGSIAAGSSASAFFDLAVREDAMQGPSNVDILLEYEDENGEAATLSQSISISILQRVRVVTEPAIVNNGDAVTAGEPCPVRLKLLNLGMADIRNVRAHVEGDGLTTFESYFGRTLLPSESANVTLRILSEAGEHSGHVVVTFESLDGETHELSEPIRVNAEDAAPPVSETPPPEAETNDSLMTAIIAGASALAIAFGALAFFFFKTRAGGKSKNNPERANANVRKANTQKK